MAYIRCIGNIGGSIKKKTASGSIATFTTAIPTALADVTSVIGYRESGYTSATAINSKTAPIHDFAPYHTRINNNIGDLAMEKLVGVSCVFNQLVQNGNFESTTGWTAQNGSINSASNNELDVSYLGNGEFGQNVFCGLGFTPDANHVFFTTVDVKLPNTNGTIGLLGGSQSNLVSTTATTNWQTLSAIFKGNTYSYFIIRNTTSNVEIANAKLRNAMFIDLTAMFGSTVADYIYTLESGNAGAGVSLFKSLFADEYYPYTANTLMSAKPTGKKIVGFNQWDEEWELGSYSWGTGQPFADNTRIRNKNYIPVFPNINYFNSNSGYAVDYYFYDADKNFISPLYKAAGNQTITTPANCYYMNFCVYASYGTTYNHDICINISDNAKNGTYEPYSETTIVYSGNELRGLLKVGTDGLYADGDIDDGSGSTQVKWATKTFNGSENWTVTSYNGHYRAYTSISDIKSFSGTSDDKTDNVAITDKYIVGTWYQVLTGKSVCGQTGTNVGFGIDELGITTAEAWKTWLSNNELSIIYRLATPTTAVSTAWSNPIIAKEGGTEEFIDGNEYSIVDLGSLTWVKIGMGGGRNGFRATINEMILTPAANIKINAKCSKYITYTGNEVYLGNIGISGWGANTHDVAVYDPDYESGDATAFKTAMNGVYLIYENTNSVGFQLFSGHDTIYGTDMTVNKAEFGTTVYGGSVDFTTGEVISNKNADGTDKTAETIAISPVMVGVFEGDNYIISDANGSNSVKYFKKG